MAYFSFKVNEQPGKHPVVLPTSEGFLLCISLKAFPERGGGTAAIPFWVVATFYFLRQLIIENSLRGLRYRLRKETTCQKAEPSGQLSQATYCVLIQDLIPFHYGMLVCVPDFKAQSFPRHPIHEGQLRSHGNCSQNKVVVFLERMAWLCFKTPKCCAMCHL